MSIGKSAFACATLFAVSVIVGGCASYPSDPAGQIKHHIKEAQRLISKGNVEAANFEFAAVLGKPGGGERLRELFISDAATQEVYLTGLESSISGAESTDDLITAAAKLANAKSIGLLPANELARLNEGLGRTAVNGNQSGRLPFTLADRVGNIPELTSPSQQEIMFERTLNMIREDRLKKPPVSAVMAYVGKAGATSSWGKRAEALLPMMKIRVSDLPSVEPLYPAYAAKRREEISGRVHLQIRNADRIFQEDLRDALKKSFSRIVFEPAAGPGITTVMLEKIRHEERVTPERSETITYAQHEVNIVSAVLLMPKNASYIYDIVKGANEVEYGFALTAAYDGRTIYDELLRGKVGGAYTRCVNLRIQNVFGGVSSAGFVANDDMQNRCYGGSNTPKTIDELRGDVMDKVVEGILKVPTISAAYDAN